MIPSALRTSRISRLALLLVFGFGIALAGCGGGSPASAALGQGPAPTAAPGPSATSSAPAYVVHVIIEASGAQNLTLLPAGAQAPSGASVGPAIPGAIVTYPDGSQQVADLNGAIVPANSAYGQANAATLETNLEAAPFVTISDPNGAGRPITAQVDASSLMSTAVSSTAISPQNAYAHILAGSPQINLAHVQIHPRFINAAAGQTIPLEVVGLDNNGAETSLAGTTIFWAPPQQGGTIMPIPGTNRALFRAPAAGAGVAGAGVSVTATNGTATQSYSAAYDVAYIDGATNATLSGKIQSASPVPAGSFVEFVQRSGLPSAVHPFAWYAQIDATGSFTRTLPQSQSFTPVIGLNTAKGTLFEGLTSATGSMYTSGPAGSSANVTFTLASNPTLFVDNSTGYQPLPPISSYIRDAWFASAIPLERHIFDADSGLQPILASPSTSATGTVSDGLFKYWKYQWSGTAAAPLLSIVEAYSNGAAGRRTAAISVGGNNTYTYLRYYAPNGAVSTAAPLVANQPGMLLNSDGSWTQTSAAGPGAASSSFSASVKVDTYNSSHQILGSPVYVETLTYSRSATGAVQLSNDNYTNATGSLLWTFNGARSGLNSGAYGTSQMVYTYSGTLVRVYHITSGDTRTTFNLAGTVDGDGSGNVAYTNGSTGTQVTYALLAASAISTLRANNGIVATPNANPSTQATFTVSSSNTVTATIEPDPANNFPGTQVTFGL